MMVQIDLRTLLNVKGRPQNVNLSMVTDFEGVVINVG